MATLEIWPVLTVNSEIFASVLFSRNFAYAKFRENKALLKWRNHSFTGVGKSCPSREFLTWQICLLMLFAKIKFSRKFAVLHTCMHVHVCIKCTL